MTLCYPTLDQAIEVHRKTVEKSGGGALGHLELGKLESVLCHIQNDDYYPSFEQKLSHLFYSVCKFHCFQDGNKRLALALSAHMLLINGYLYCSGRFIVEMENISFHVANGNIDKELLLQIITAYLHGESEDESLKLKILNAISGQS